MTTPGEFTPDPEDRSEPNDNGGELGETFGHPDDLFHGGDGITADETEMRDLDDEPPEASGSFEEREGYDEDEHNREMASLLDSVERQQAEPPVAVSEEDKAEAWRVMCEAALEYLGQDSRYLGDPLGGNGRSNEVQGSDGTGHTMEVTETPVDKVELLHRVFKVTIQSTGDEQTTGHGADYTVHDDGEVTRKYIEPQPRDLADIDRAMDIGDIGRAAQQSTDAMWDAIADIIARGVASGLQEDKMGMGHRVVGPVEAQAVAHILLGRYIQSDRYNPDDPLHNL